MLQMLELVDDGVKEGLIVGDLCFPLTVFLPFEKIVGVKLELNYRCDELTISQRLECTDVLLNDIMQVSQLSATSFLERGCVEDYLNVRMLNKARPIITRFETFDGLLIVFSRV